MHRAEHDAPDNAVHGEPLHLGSLEHGALHPVRNDKCRRMEEQAEIVGTIGVAGHAVGLEILQVFHPQLHLTPPAISAVGGLCRVVPVLGHHESDVGPLRADLYLGNDAL